MDTNESTPVPENSPGCANCGSSDIADGYPTPLCHSCRDQFIKYPIPVGILIFGIAIALVVAFSMFSLPGQLRTGIHFERGVQAVKARKFRTAERELAQVVEEHSAFDEAKEYRAIAAFYNQDLALFSEMLGALEGKEVTDDKLYADIQQAMAEAPFYFPSDSFIVFLQDYPSIDSVSTIDLERFVSDHSDDYLATARLASQWISDERLQEADSLANILLEWDALNQNALYIKASAKRLMQEYDSSHIYCERLILLNAESTMARASRARTYLAEGKDADGLQWAIGARDNEPNNGYALATLALAYHFNQLAEKCEQTLAELRSDSSKLSQYQYVQDVRSGKEKFRK